VRGLNTVRYALSGKSNFENTFTKKLLFLRQRFMKADGRMGLTQGELATKLFVDKSTVRNWEHGRSRPQVIHRRALSTLFPDL